MFDIVGRRSFETSVLAGLLFYVFANPSTFKMVKKIPGLKFVMKGTSEITHSGVLTHALVFGVALFFVCWFINETTLRDHIHVVEGLEGLEAGGGDVADDGGDDTGDYGDGDGDDKPMPKKL